MDFIEEIRACIPEVPSREIPWDRIGRLLPVPGFSEMDTVPQNPVFHGEGDVSAHTRMVCGELAGIPAFRKLPAQQKAEVFLAAVLHDIGKVRTTRLEDGNWVSPHHASSGSRTVRKFLWRDCGLCGTKNAIVFRETVCTLIRYHMLPFHLMSRDDPKREVLGTAAAGMLAADFSWNLLCMLAEADARGRIADDLQEELSRVELARMMAEEAGCLTGPYPFASGFTRRACLSGRSVPPDQVLFDDTWGEVILLSGLPGTGKDTWIRQHHPEMPVVSLDQVRAELGIRPADPQDEVLLAARERAKEYLRLKQPFIWNATDLTRDIRKKWIELFERYGARVRVVYLETDWKTREIRNASRTGAVPEKAVAAMLERTVPPTPDEAQTVEWICC